MRNKRLFISVIIITLLLIVAGVLFLLYYLNKEEEKPEYVFNFTDVEYPYGFKWGMSREEVEDQILAKGLYKETKHELLICNDNNFQNNIGLDSRVVFLFIEKDELSDIMIIISFENKTFDFTEEEFIDAYNDELSRIFGPDIEVNDTFIYHYWYNEETLISLRINEEKNEYSYCFSNVKDNQALVDELELLR